MLKYFPNILVGIGFALLGAVAGIGVYNLKVNDLHNYLVESGCVSIGPPGNPVVAKHISEGFNCGGALVVIPR